MLQENWEKLGTTFDDQNKFRIQIENGLEDPHKRKLEESEERCLPMYRARLLR